ncbi:hypothetical protein EK904_013206, partial [Melospiza melodia maxima]
FANAERSDINCSTCPLWAEQRQKLHGGHVRLDSMEGPPSPKGSAAAQRFPGYRKRLKPRENKAFIEFVGAIHEQVGVPQHHHCIDAFRQEMVISSASAHRPYLSLSQGPLPPPDGVGVEDDDQQAELIICKGSAQRRHCGPRAER